MFRRIAQKYLYEWAQKEERKPLVLVSQSNREYRGAAVATQLHS